MAFRKWLSSQAITARMARSFLLTALPVVTANNVLALDLEVWKVAAIAGASAALTPFFVWLAKADEKA